MNPEWASAGPSQTFGFGNVSGVGSVPCWSLQRVSAETIFGLELREAWLLVPLAGDPTGRSPLYMLTMASCCRRCTTQG